MKYYFDTEHNTVVSKEQIVQEYFADHRIGESIADRIQNSLVCNGGTLVELPGDFVRVDSAVLSIKSLCDAVKTLSDDDLELLCLETVREQECRDSQRQRQLAGAIASAMDAYLRKVGDKRDFYSRGGEYMSMQDMYDAIVNEFDLTAQ